MLISYLPSCRVRFFIVRYIHRCISYVEQQLQLHFDVAYAQVSHHQIHRVANADESTIHSQQVSSYSRFYATYNFLL